MKWFQPKLLGLHALVIGALVFTVWMGIWQLGVYDQRQENARADRKDVPTVPLNEVLGPDQAFHGEANHRPVNITGQWLDQQFWVANRVQDDRSGYWLAAPFVTETGSALIVARGFALDTAEVPEVPTGEHTFEVVLEPSEAASGGLGQDNVIDSLRIATLVNEIDVDLYSGFGINADSDQTGGLALINPPLPETSWTVGSRNLVYALQWWVFGAFAVFMWWRMCLDILATQREQV